MQLEDYTTGTVSISKGSAALTGTGTAWDVANFKAGDTFHAQGLVGIVASVDSDAAITLRDVWTGTSISGGDYLLRYQPDNSRMQGTTRQLLDELRQGIWLTPDATGKTADKATYDSRPAGFRFLDVSVDPFKLYVKESDTSGDWSSGADWVGPQGDAGPAGADGDITWDGPWVTATAYTTNQAVSNGGSSYVCVEDHTSGAFATDLAAGKWELMAQKGDKGDTGDTGAPGADGTDGTNGTDGADGVVQSIVAGKGISVDSTDTANPKVTALVRELLTANRTYYVATTGSDTNDGLTSGTAFLTLQNAWNVVAGLDLSIYTVTIQVADGTYSAGVNFSSAPIGGAGIVIQGNTTTPSACVISLSGSVFYANQGSAPVAQLTIRGFSVASSAGYGFFLNIPGFRAIINNMEYGACNNAHIYAGQGAYVSIGANYSVIGQAPYHFITSGGSIFVSSITVTFTGTLAFTQFARASGQGRITANGTSFTGGTITGTRYFSDGLSLIDTNGGGASFFPGNVAGSVSNGAIYK